MNKKKTYSKKKINKPKKIGILLNKVFEEYKKKQKNNEKKEIRLREEAIKKDQVKIITKEKEQKLKDEDLKKKEEQIKKKDED